MTRGEKPKIAVPSEFDCVRIRLTLKTALRSLRALCLFDSDAKAVAFQGSNLSAVCFRGLDLYF